MKRSEPNRKLNIWVARAVPLLLLGIIGYVLWVVTKLICVDYLLQPRFADAERQTGSAAAILTILYVLLLFLLVCYGRLLDVVARDPGLVPYGRQWFIEQAREKQSRHRRHSDTHKSPGEEKSRGTIPRKETVTDDTNIWVEDFWKRDVFVCKYDGRPQFCSTCYSWKPDRSHHCSELNRCVLKMDHFCPWVSGVVGETSFKFFIQFTFWAAWFCLHVLVSVAYFFAQRQRLEGAVNANWAVAMGLAGFFFLFSAGMCISSLQFAFINSTTIENLDRTRRQWCLAIHIPEHKIQKVQRACGDDLRLITYPRPPNEQPQKVELSDTGNPLGVATTPNQERPELDSSTDVPPANERRTFGIFMTERGENPWSLGLLENFQDIMGDTIWDWVLPITKSPCTDHKSAESFYKTGPVVNRMKVEAGILDSPDDVSKGKHRRRRKRRTNSHAPRRERVP